VNLLANPGFEDQPALAGCGQGWTVSNGTLTISPIARSGDASCLVCTSNAGTQAALRPTAPPPPAASVGVTYVASGWILATDDDAGNGEGQAQLAEDLTDGAVSYPTSGRTMATSAWTQVAIQEESTEVGELFVFHLLVTVCVLVDDVALYALP
jgi:hypothetical protein